jgi:spoIIIJ-associated protein
MENLKLTVQKMLEIAGFNDHTINADAENKKLAVFINEGDWFKNAVPAFLSDINHIVKVMARKQNLGNVVIDVNNYRLERERLILELARAAAQKAAATKSDVELPPMNAYERRLVHTELATRPDIKTESIGEGKERRVVVKPL